MRRVGGVLEIAVAVNEEQEHVLISQIGAERDPSSAEDAVQVAERQRPGRMLRDEVEHPRGQVCNAHDARCCRG